MSTRRKEESRASKSGWRPFDENGRGCDGKVRYRNKNVAREVMTAMQKRNRARGEQIGLNIYKCRECGRYHVGHKPYWA